MQLKNLFKIFMLEDAWRCTVQQRKPNNRRSIRGKPPGRYNRSLTRLWQSPQLNWRLPTIYRELPKLRDSNKASEASRAPRQQQPYRALQVPKSNKLLNFNSTESSWRTQTDATYAMARTLEVLKSFTLKSHQSNKCFGERRGRTRKNSTNESTRSRCKSFPSLRGEMDWWNTRYRWSPLSFPFN